MIANCLLQDVQWTGSWRTGKFEAVMGGDFDLIGAADLVPFGALFAHGAFVGVRGAAGRHGLPPLRSAEVGPGQPLTGVREDRIVDGIVNELRDDLADRAAPAGADTA